VHAGLADSITSGGCENYHMAGEHMHIMDVFSNNFIKMANFL
jgi:hypothetical protein